MVLENSFGGKGVVESENKTDFEFEKRVQHWFDEFSSKAVTSYFGDRAVVDDSIKEGMKSYFKDAGSQMAALAQSDELKKWDKKNERFGEFAQSFEVAKGLSLLGVVDLTRNEDARQLYLDAAEKVYGAYQPQDFFDELYALIDEFNDIGSETANHVSDTLQELDSYVITDEDYKFQINNTIWVLGILLASDALEGYATAVKYSKTVDDVAELTEDQQLNLAKTNKLLYQLLKLHETM
jgi:hypothetical protein